MKNKYARCWIDIVLHPSKAVKENKVSNYSFAVKSLVIAGLIAGIISAVGAFFTTQALMNAQLAAVISIVFGPIGALIGWIVISGVLYVFAVLFSGKGTFASQSHLIAVMSSAFGIINSVVGLIAIAWLWAAIGISAIIFIYELYILTMVLKSVHKYSTSRAVLTWLVPLLIVAIIVIIVIGFAMPMLMRPAPYVP